METLLPPLLILLAVAAAVVLVMRLGAKRTRASVDSALAGGPEAAAAASARLSREAHQTVYSLIARGSTVQAIAAYRLATGVGITEARNAILLMDQHPQPYRGTTVPEDVPDTPLPDSPAPESTAPEPAPVEPTPAVASSAPGPPRFPYRYRAIVTDGRTTLEVASNMLNDEIYGEIKSLAQIGDAEDAAQMLQRHSDISLDEARAFVALL